MLSILTPVTPCVTGAKSFLQCCVDFLIDWQSRMAAINQSINAFIMRHGTEARATVRIMPKQREMS